VLAVEVLSDFTLIGFLSSLLNVGADVTTLSELFGLVDLSLSRYRLSFLEKKLIQ
jgi:site-specific recombinase XerD